jgi:hypothetical protein
MLKSIFRNWYRYVLWALLSVIFWSWIVMLKTDAQPNEKVVLYADLPALDGEGLELRLEETMPDGIRFVKAHAFLYSLFNDTDVLKGDLYLVSDRYVEDFIGSFVPIDTSLFPNATFYEKDGVAYGVCVYDEAAGLYAAEPYVTYLAGERCWLFFNEASGHLGAWNDSPDDAAIAVARDFLNLQ